MGALIGASTIFGGAAAAEEEFARSSNFNREAQSFALQAGEIERRARINKERQLDEKEKFKGLQVSGFARGGIDVSSGSPLEVVAESEAVADRFILEQEIQAQKSALAARQRAAAARSAARKSRRFAPFRAIGSILTTGASVFGSR